MTCGERDTRTMEQALKDMAYFWAPEVMHAVNVGKVEDITVTEELHPRKVTIEVLFRE
jgi:hypothetical protein